MILKIKRYPTCCLFIIIIIFQASLQNSTPRKYKIVKTCKFDNLDYKNVLELICIQCHEFFSYTSPNLRAQCRTNCFDNSIFIKCLNIFEPHNIK
ncbi:Crustacean neurohormone family-containing protein [Strongyloides ratti]|uniref:Crustacean neurohormone family-containing protein n=1 Tax=Strongyloides ratti TaxID=34506 RepID=A0A090LIC6_STRRB|nr:Crustacean neurohormone family-containing protein [Strongyloides ratti]CEF67220.1 Crustacean neurohormone family-containing protein [Strongyloides ratti]